MLVLPRKRFQSIVISNDIIITVVVIRDDKVRLGIVAPRDVPVHRQEVYDAIHGEFAAGAVPITFNPTLAETDDILPDLIVECRLAQGSQGLAEFTSESGFFFLDNPNQQPPDGTTSQKKSSTSSGCSSRPPAR